MYDTLDGPVVDNVVLGDRVLDCSVVSSEVAVVIIIVDARKERYILTINHLQKKSLSLV